MLSKGWPPLDDGAAQRCFEVRHSIEIQKKGRPSPIIYVSNRETTSPT